MRVLLTSASVPSHFYPMVPLGTALLNAGHDVAFAAAPSLCPSIAKLGFETFACGVNSRGMTAEVLPNAPMLGDGEAWTRFMVAHVFGRLQAQSLATDVLFVAREWEPAIIVRESFEYGGCIAAEVLGIPHAVLEVGAQQPTYFRRLGLDESLDAVRADFGLPADPGGAMLARYLHLSVAPPSFHDPAEPLPATAHPIRHVPFDASGDERLPPWVGDLGQMPTVYVTLGSVLGRNTRLLATLISALRDEPLNVVVTMGRRQNPEALGSQPDNVHVARYIPNTLLLPYCDVVVSHAGWSTTLGALCAGVPQVCVPLTADQPFNARRCAELGAGIVIDPDELTGEILQDAVKLLLSQPRFREAARRVQAENQMLPGLERAVELLERLAYGRQPLLSCEAA
jgi:UDP:flavonoid glycosyltransferase YjiC (YdhE family)